MDDWTYHGEEGCGKLQKSSARRTQSLNRGYPNATSAISPKGRATQGIETSEYLQEKKSTEMLSVTASERSARQTECVSEMVCRCGVTDLLYLRLGIGSCLKRHAKECESHVRTTEQDCEGILNTAS